MSGSLNKVMLIGRLGKDPEGRDTGDGTRVVKFSLATSETWRDKQSGERKEKTFWHNVVIFNEALGKVAESYCHKGSRVYLEGQLQTRKWTDQSGQERYTTEVVLQRFRGELTLLDGPKDKQEDSAHAPQPGAHGAQGGGLDDDGPIPFAPLRELP